MTRHFLYYYYFIIKEKICIYSTHIAFQEFRKIFFIKCCQSFYKYIERDKLVSFLLLFVFIIWQKKKKKGRRRRLPAL
jgi:hypothetical protein